MHGIYFLRIRTNNMKKKTSSIAVGYVHSERRTCKLTLITHIKKDTHTRFELGDCNQVRVSTYLLYLLIKFNNKSNNNIRLPFLPLSIVCWLLHFGWVNRLP